jgi:hypothetical protein
MNTITTIFVFALCLAGALAAVVPADAQEEQRTLYDTSNGMYLGLNSTVLWVAVIGLAVVAVLALVVLPQTGLLDDISSQQRYDHEQQYYQQQGQDPYRTKRSYNENMVTRMLQLEQIFKKYEVEEDECRAYIACEAANVERLAENGPLVQQVHEFFNAVNSAKPEHLAKINNNKSMWIMKQAYDSAKHRQQEFDVCKPLREGCQGVRQKKN